MSIKGISSHLHAPLAKRPRSRKFLIAVWIIVVLTSGLVGRRFIASGSIDNHQLFISPRFLALGEFWSRRIERTLEVENHGRQDIEIVKFVTSTNRAVISPALAHIPAGGSARINATIDLSVSPFHGGQMPWNGPITIDVAAIVRGSPIPARWRLSGMLRRSVAFAPKVIEFAASELNTATKTPWPTRHVELVAAREVADIRARCDRRFAEVAIARQSSSDARPRYKLSVTPTPNQPPGPFLCDVTIFALTATEPLFETGHVAVRGMVVDDVEFIPGGIRLPPAPVGATLRRMVYARSRTESPFSIEKWDAPNDSSIYVSPQNTRDAQWITVEQAVGAVGLHSSTIQFTVRQDDARRIVPLDVVYYGTSAPAQ